MRKALLGLLGLCGYSICGVGQVGLYLTSGTNVSISPTTVFSVDGLVLTPTAVFSINSPNSLTRDANIVHTALQTHILRVYHFANTTINYNGHVAFYYEDSERNGIAENALTLNTHNGSIWQYFTPVSRDATNNVVVTNNLPGITLNELTLADMLSPLPLRWGPISAQRQLQGAVIKWETANESGIAFFQVESSLDAIHWTPVGNRSTPANSSGIHLYELMDGSVTAAPTFYRVKQAASNGSFSYSSIVAVKALVPITDVLVYPNPTVNRVTILAAPRLLSLLKLYDTNGRMLHFEKLSDVSSHSLDLSGLPKGTYHIEIELDNGNKQRQPVLKQ